jgi:DnaJ family protein C protein 7
MALSSARNASNHKQYDEAKALFTSCLEHIPEKSPLFPQILSERAENEFKAERFESALMDASKAIYLRDDTRKAWYVRFWVLGRLGRHEEAINDGRELLNRWGGSDHVIRSLVEKAEFDLRKSQRPDLYQILGVGQLASELEIKAAYKQQALIYHPDKQPTDASVEDKNKAEAHFKLLGIALDVLGNADKRKLWDEGYDLKGIEEELKMREMRHHRKG